MEKNVKKKSKKSQFDKFSLIVNISSLPANFITLASFGFNLINYGKQGTMGIIIWLGILMVIPILYSWGFFAWFLNSKYHKPHESVVFTGIAFSPIFIFWIFIINYEDFNPDVIITIIVFQFIVGCILSYALSKWNILVGNNIEDNK